MQELPPDIRAGLEVYGHRSKGDCQDIEIVVPVGSGNRQTLINQIEAITPRGKTPITQAFQQAADQLRAMEDETTVVLVSDGKETCEGDPCTLVRELREQGIKIKVHVVGFDVTHDESEQLVCIADAGGGKYFSAQNSQQLMTALAEVREEVVKKIAVPETTCVGDFANGFPENYKTYTGLSSQKAIAFNRQGNCYAAGWSYGYGDEQQAIDWAMQECRNWSKKNRLTEESECQLYAVNDRLLEPMRQVLNEFGLAKASDTKKVEVKKISISKPGTLVFNWVGDDFWEIYRGETRINNHHGTGKQELQAGTYTIKPQFAPVFEPFDVTIEAGETTTVTLGGTLVFNWVGDDFWEIYRGETLVNNHNGKDKQGLQAGTYIIRPQFDPVFEPFEITIEDGQTLIVE